MAGLNWYKYLKKYVWNDEKTPYLTSVNKLNKKQADYELFPYVCFMSILFTVIALTSFSSQSLYGRSYGIAFYAISIVLSAIMLSITRNTYPAIYCAAAPFVILLYFLISGNYPGRHAIDTVAIITVIGLLAWYSLRVIAIARGYETMADLEQDND